MLTEQERRCAVSGLEFSFKEYRATVRHPFGPSIDRKSSKLGYDPSNVRLVCAAVNFGLGEWGDEVFLPIARGVVCIANALEAKLPSDPQERPAAASLEERLDAAIDLMDSMRGAEQLAQKRRVAALKAALTKGPEARKRAAYQAWRTRRGNRTHSPVEPKP